MQNQVVYRDLTPITQQNKEGKQLDLEEMGINAVKKPLLEP